MAFAKPPMRAPQFMLMRFQRRSQAKSPIYAAARPPYPASVAPLPRTGFFTQSEAVLLGIVRPAVYEIDPELPEGEQSVEVSFVDHYTAEWFRDEQAKFTPDAWAYMLQMRERMKVADSLPITRTSFPVPEPWPPEGTLRELEPEEGNRGWRWKLGT